MVLRLEHVEHVGAERLRRLHDVRPRGIRLAGDREVGRGAVDLDAGPEQGVDELRRRQEVRLVRRHDVPARVTARRVVEEAGELRGPARVPLGRLGHPAAAPPRPPRPTRLRPRPAGPPWRRLDHLGCDRPAIPVARSIALWPISQMLNRSCSRCREA